MITTQKKIGVFNQTEKGRKIIADFLMAYADYCESTGKRVLNCPSLLVKSWDFVGWGCCSYLTVTSINRGWLGLRKRTPILQFKRGPLKTCEWKIRYIKYDQVTDIIAASDLLRQHTRIAEEYIGVFEDYIDGQMEPPCNISQ